MLTVNGMLHGSGGWSDSHGVHFSAVGTPQFLLSLVELVMCAFPPNIYSIAEGLHELLSSMYAGLCQPV